MWIALALTTLGLPTGILALALARAAAMPAPQPPSRDTWAPHPALERARIGARRGGRAAWSGRPEVQPLDQFLWV